MLGCSTPTLFYAVPPPLSLRQKACGPSGMKNTPDLARQIGSANRVAR